MIWWTFRSQYMTCVAGLHCSLISVTESSYIAHLSFLQALITQTRAKQAATMSEVEWRGRTVPVKIDKARIFLLGLADNEAAIAQVRTNDVTHIHTHSVYFRLS